MGFTNLLCFFFYILVCSSLTTAQECYYTGNFAANSTYGKNRDLILSSLASNITLNGGFYMATIGQEPNKVYALALCRGDSSSETCAYCVNSSAQDIMVKCPNQKEAISWGLDPPCIVRYANRPIFGILELSPKRAGSNLLNIKSNFTEFDKVWGTLMEHTVRKASVGSSRLRFATAEANVTNSEKIYALMQCTPDISRSNCGICLRQSVSYFQSGSRGKQGGNVQTPNCLFRWEIFRFYGDVTWGNFSPPQLTNATITKDGEGITPQRVLVIVASTIIFIALVAFTCFFLQRRKSKQKVRNANEIDGVESFVFDFITIKVATKNFSIDNKLGQGGFGTVYKGRLLDGRNIAVKRLSKSSGQGELEFKNEVILLAKLQHRNLVRLLGFCLEGNERLLIYEFVPNLSLDNFIFDPIKSTPLDWEIRFNIIRGIARGILYLHEDSRLRVIHRDLKPSNILLDMDMNPKVSDFGMARLFEMDQTQGNTSTVVGTFGYMAPEYVTRGLFSVKSDVFSFGVLLLEIISGQRNSCFSYGEEAEDLLTYTWRNWEEGTSLNVIDPILSVDSSSEILRCIHIGILCVQENVAHRPTMTSVFLMLTSNSVSLPEPSKPAYYMRTIIMSNCSKSRSVQFSVNEAPITELVPR